MLSEPSIKRRLYQQFARIGKCLSSDKRLELMDLLSNGPKSVESLAQLSGLSVANVSQHLQVLRDSHLVKFRKEGTYAIYCLDDPVVAEFLLVLWKLCENRLADIPRIKEELLHQYEGVCTITKKMLLQQIANDTIIVLDLRPRDEYAAGHIEGAISVPLDELDDYLSSLCPKAVLAAYCYGPYCNTTIEAVKHIQKRGFTAFRINESVQEWKSL